MANSNSTWYRHSWTELHALGSSKIVNSAFIWLIIIPFLSRVLLTLNSEYGKDITLPFNFLAFYYAAFFFTVASAVFNWNCPTVAKLAPTFGSFKAGGYSALELKNWYHDMVPSPTSPSKRNGELIIQFLTNVRQSHGLSPEEYAENISRLAGPNTMANFWLIQIPENKLPDAHDLAIGIANKGNAFARLVATISYQLGFLLFGVVIIYNLTAVVKETLLLFK